MTKDTFFVEGTVKDKLSSAARVMSQSGASKGGLAAARKLTPTQRKNRARNAARTRWKKQRQKKT